MTAPIVLFTYNRPQHLQTLVESLLQNDLAKQSPLFVFSDGCKTACDEEKVAEVRAYLHTLSGFQSVTIVESPENKGLAKSVIHGVTQVLKQYDRVIVLEDDLILSPYFLRFMNEALETYKDEERVGNVNGHMPALKHVNCETFFIHHADSWGWGTWKRAWQLFEPDGQKLLEQLEARNLCKQFDFDGAYPFVRMLRRQIAGQNNSWAIRWRASLQLNDKLCLNPGKSLVLNNGADGSGTHVPKGVLFPDAPLADKPIIISPDAPVETMQAREAYKRYYRWNNSKVHKAIVKLQNLL